MVKIAIIGAGCAGLAAAATLLAKAEGKIEVVLIDAFLRLGGRAWTITSGGFPFDLGPQYIQDPGINPWMQIAKALDFDTLPAEHETIYRIKNGDNWEDAHLAPAGVQRVGDSINESYEEAKTVPNAPATIQIDATDPDTEIALGSDGLGSIGESAEPWQYIASDRARQTEVAIADSGIAYVRAGVGGLVAAFGQSLLTRYPTHLETMLGKVVTCIDWRADKGCFDIVAQSELLCNSQYCIVTVPCSALPRISFIPPLEQARVAANGYICLGSYKKVAFLADEEPDQIEANVQYYMFDYQNQGCWQYFRLPTNTNAIIGVASGNFAAKLDRLDDSTVGKAFLQALNAAYPTSGPIVPAHTPLVTNWSKQPHVWGAYSYTRYDGGSFTDPVPLAARDEIARPHANGRLRFAGEATWTGAYGTIHGAYFSGERAAMQILSELGLA